jgi:hypothetical protein
MLRLPILLSGLLLVSTTDTVWWRTDGGTVTQHREGAAATCMLQIYNQVGQFSFIWDNSLPTRVVVDQTAWKFAPDQLTTVGLRVGSTWLENGNGAPNITAMTGSSAFMFILDQPVDELLLSADDIALKASDTGFGITLSRSRMQALITALRKCRAVIGR